jgi:hypothetical protein
MDVVMENEIPLGDRERGKEKEKEQREQLERERRKVGLPSKPKADHVISECLFKNYKMFFSQSPPEPSGLAECRPWSPNKKSSMQSRRPVFQRK